MALFKLSNIVNYVSYLTVKSVKGTLASCGKPTNVYCFVRLLSSKHIMKVLNVAEKHDAAKNIVAHLSRGNNRKVNNTCFILLFYDD